jgi:hypothetical protein
MDPAPSCLPSLVPSRRPRHTAPGPDTAPARRTHAHARTHARTHAHSRHNSQGTTDRPRTSATSLHAQRLAFVRVSFEKGQISFRNFAASPPNFAKVAQTPTIFFRSPNRTTPDRPTDRTAHEYPIRSTLVVSDFSAFCVRRGRFVHLEVDPLHLPWIISPLPRQKALTKANSAVTHTSLSRAAPAPPHGGSGSEAKRDVVEHVEVVGHAIEPSQRSAAPRAHTRSAQPPLSVLGKPSPPVEFADMTHSRANHAQRGRM